MTEPCYIQKDTLQFLILCCFGFRRKRRKVFSQDPVINESPTRTPHQKRTKNQRRLGQDLLFTKSTKRPKKREKSLLLRRKRKLLKR